MEKNNKKKPTIDDIKTKDIWKGNDKTIFKKEDIEKCVDENLSKNKLQCSNCGEVHEIKDAGWEDVQIGEKIIKVKALVCTKYTWYSIAKIDNIMYVMSFGEDVFVMDGGKR